MEKERKLGRRLYMRAKPEQRLFIRNVGVKPVERKLGRRLYMRAKPEHHLYIRNVKKRPEWLIYAPHTQEAA